MLAKKDTAAGRLARLRIFQASSGRRTAGNSSKKDPGQPGVKKFVTIKVEKSTIKQLLFFLSNQIIVPQRKRSTNGTGH